MVIQEKLRWRPGLDLLKKQIQFEYLISWLLSGDGRTKGLELFLINKKSLILVRRRLVIFIDILKGPCPYLVPVRVTE